MDWLLAGRVLRLNFYIDGAEDVFVATDRDSDHRAHRSATGAKLRPGLHGVARREKTTFGGCGCTLVPSLQGFEGEYSQTDGQDG